MSSWFHSRRHGYFHHQFTRIETVCREGFPQLLGSIDPVCPHRLLYQVVEKLRDEGRMDLRAVREESSQLAGPGEGRGRPGAGLVAAGGIDALAVFLIPVSAHRVEILQGESERVHHAMAGR